MNRNRARILHIAGSGLLALACGAADVERVGANGAALGVTYYVASNGNDANPGTAAAPWRTLQKAVDSIGPGDTILVAQGSYAGARVTSSGSSGAPKTLKAAPGARPVLNALAPRAAHNAILELENYDATIGHWVVDGFEITGAPGAGVDLRGTEYVTVQNCFVHHNGQARRATGIFMAFSDHPRIVNNESSYNSEHGIYQSNSGDYPVLENNRLHHNTVCGIHVNGDASYGGDGQVSFATIQGNVIYENGASGGSAVNLDGVSDSLIANNLIYGNRAAGISLFQIDGAQPSSRNRVYGNTIVMPGGSRWAISVPDAGATGIRIVDNILHHPDAGRGVISVYAPSAVQSDYNVISGRLSANGQTSSITLDQWRAYGHDAHSRVAAPADLFVNAGAGDYHLKAGAAAVDAGTPLSELPRDGDGEARPQGAGVDIGWDERTVAGTPPPPPPPGCVTASGVFKATEIAAQTGSFTLDWDVTPSASAVDAAVALAAGSAGRWTDLAAIVRFNLSGRIDARNAGGYAALQTLGYSAGIRYHVRMVVDVARRRYDAFVQPAGGAEVAIARDYAFRTEQQQVQSLARAVVASGQGTLSACDLALDGGATACARITGGAAPVVEPITAATGTLSVVRHITPGAAALDLGVGLSSGAASRWSDFAANVRFNTANTIDVRNAGGYGADRSVRYAPGQRYRLRFVVDVTAHRYDVYVTPPGGSEQALARGYAFRTGQHTVSRLDHVVGLGDTGSAELCP